MEKLKSFILDILMFMIILSVVSVAGLIDIRTSQSNEGSPIEKEIGLQLEKYNNDIKTMGDKIAKETKELEELKKQIDSMKDNNNSKSWNSSIITYNTKLTQYKKDMEEYNKKIEEHNKIYSQYTLLGEKNESVLVWVKTLIGI
ncbi:hypothetical protein N4T77_08160 [Clostridium sp. CX1]|uniref:hypothetical protein n=1 Tax=Clostridium sp. CX1 TaxID=2978346 RepID=UPI0021C122BB|nr:hypothetical protein [Clostridium sp. CX1]MCT8976568.1 hypothetical protein [Clostridium sp. CX1]